MKDLRRQNLIWTVAEDHLIPLGEPLFQERGTLSQDFYPLGLEGLTARVYDRKRINEFLRKHVNGGNNKRDLRQLFALLLDRNLKVWAEVLRPGLASRREDAISYRLELFQRRGRKNFEEELAYTYFTLDRDEVPMTTPLYRSLVEDLRNSPRAGTTEELLSIFEALVKKYFHTNPGLAEVESPKEDLPWEKPQVKKDEPSRKVERRLGKDEPREEDLEKYSIYSAEFTNSLYEDFQRVDKEEESPLLVMRKGRDVETRRKVRQHYGIPSGSDHEMKALEEKHCVGIHEGIRLYRTKGVFDDDPVSRYYRDLVSEQEILTKKAWEKKGTIYRRSILQLQEILKKSVLQDMEEEKTLSSAGNILPSRIWRQRVLGDGKIFQKIHKNEWGTLTVDLLLDASGSQDDRRDLVAIQGFIIAEALSKCNIPTRVVGYSNLFNYLVFREYRDYHDAPGKNREILKYYTGGSNRDGLAIKVIADTMEQAEHNILIVLNDGRPNDKINIGMVGDAGFNGVNYEGEDALRDTAGEVLQTRLKGVSTLGIFTGEEEDVENQKRMYGTDFAYIPDIHRFSPTVGKFLKSLVERREG